MDARNEAIELALTRSIDELYADLVDLDEDNPLRSSDTPLKKLAQAGRQQFEEIKERIQNIVCTSTFFEKINEDTDAKQLALMIFDEMTGTIEDTGLPLATTAVLVVRMGLNRLCRNMMPTT